MSITKGSAKVENKDYTNIGDQIRETVEKAIDSMDFKQLNRSISDTVNSALDEARRQIVRNVGNLQQKADKAQPGRDWKSGRHQGRARYEDAVYRDCTVSQDIGKGPGARVSISQAGRVSGILFTVFGGIGLGISLFTLLVVLLLAVMLKPIWGVLWGLVVFLAALGVVSGILLGKGTSILGRLKRLKRYLECAGGQAYCTISDMAAKIGKSPKFVIKDIGKAIQRGNLPEARLDEEKTCLMLDQETYQQYLKAKEAKAAREREDKDLKERVKDNQLAQVIQVGRDYLKTLREANEALPGQAISQKLDQLETVVGRIFEAVERHPEQVKEIQKFMEYYLPTTVKLVNAYRDFDCVPIQGDNIAMAKKEVEETIDTINQAFVQLLDDLYQDAAFDVTTDASVLQTMLKKDGFAGRDFTK